MRRATPVLTTAAIVCGMLLIAPVSAHAAILTPATQDGAGLRDAVTTANGTPDADTITLTTGTTYTLTGAGAGEDANATGDLDVTAPLTIEGNGATIDADGLDRVFDVLPGGSLTLVDVVLTGGDAPDTENGGAVRVAAGTTLAVSGGLMDANEATNAGAPAATAGSGGAIATAGVTTVLETAFTDNLVSRAGGAIEVVAGGSAEVVDAAFEGNATQALPGNGGALHITGAGTAAVAGSVLTDNTAAEGGALWNSATGTLAVTDSEITGNTATGAAPDQGGGGVFTEGGAVTIDGSVIDGNAATGAAGSGGGVLNVNGSVTVTDTLISGNTAERAGGGIEAGPLLPAGSELPTSTTLTNVTLSENSFTTPGDASPRNGAGLHLTGAGTVTVDQSIVSGNTGAREGGGLWNSAAGTLTVTDSEISGNSTDGELADQGGGGVFTEGGEVAITGSVIADNEATGALASGGGILNITGTVAVSDSSITGNSAVRAGGGVEAGPLLDVPTATPPVVGRADATTTVLSGVDLSGNVVTGPPGNGGGVHLTGAGEVLVDTSVVSGNSAVEGGGLWNSATGTTVVLNSTVAGNSASGADGGGGLYNDGGGLLAFNATVTGNEAPAGAGGAVLSVGGTAALVHASVVGNSSGVAGPVQIGNTVLTGNDGTEADGVTSFGGNVLDEAVAFAPDAEAGAQDTTGVSDPQLGDLADNGGPTPTLLPATGSPVIDAGVTVAGAMGEMDPITTLLNADQRGVSRPVDGDGDGSSLVDAGAVEAPAVAVAPVPTGPVTPPARPVVAQPDYTG